MASMRRFALALLLLLGVPLAAACTASRPEWLRQEDEACFQNRGFTEEIPGMYRGDPSRDPCWRYRGGRPSR
jgi:hypothetical protein